MWVLCKTAFALAAVEMAASEMNLPDWARFLGWAMILACYVAHAEK